uniref:Small ribosomal subunit protein uS9c n=2 Tax=Pavlovaceae TaxID=418969 RepID=M1KFS6_DIALT|nr:ribosomal protein S9 [Diacronema lutheri]YP_009863788.1 ribosomal protein S9 [Pavlova sp. NIVA-4/92]AGE93765.1 ribosomal protein S9 [Diacronema lutheri]QKE31119.1 ribosomal protein S9 [Pavlova sp. NIVA-4/92]|mmetsp:Transcript_10827/g.34185  ORF Transcript_10827/g.34185 Transcript_10827/m.34185 type:complete len:132 (-) Transcript_10827:3166-3561(-)
MSTFLSVGRRKSSIAQIRLISGGSGKISVNEKIIEEYFQYIPSHLDSALQPLKLIGEDKNFDILIKAKGGGLAGQAQAVKLGIARVLCIVVPENQQRLLRSLNLLTRDARKKERRKFGLKKARKASQFSKR